MALIVRAGRVLTLAIVVAIAIPPALARVAFGEEPVLARCIKQSSGGREWLERTLWGLRDQEGGWIGADVANSNGTHDLGPLQVNSFWVPKFATILHREANEIRQWLVHNPCFNVEAARWIFISAPKGTGEYWRAIGVYHSPTPERQMRYQLSVRRHLRHRFGLGIFRREQEAIVSPPTVGTGSCAFEGRSQ